jgi:hypothetical protein
LSYRYTSGASYDALGNPDTGNGAYSEFHLIPWYRWRSARADLCGPALGLHHEVLRQNEPVSLCRPVQRL